MTATLHVRIPETLHAAVHAAGGSRFVRDTLANALAGKSLSPEQRHACHKAANDVYKMLLEMPATDETRGALLLQGTLVAMLGPGGAS